MSSPVFDPTLVLGCTKLEATALLHGRRVTPGEVESVALITYEWWRHLRDPRSYWLTIGQAARLLRVSTGAIRTLLDSGRLPHVVHASGVPLMRRHEVEELARRQEPPGRASDDPPSSTALVVTSAG